MVEDMEAAKEHKDQPEKVMHGQRRKVVSHPLS